MDAKKAFDSVDQNYIEKTLIRYGFGPKLIGFFKTLCRDISARGLVNGYLSEIVKIYRGFKQGDAFSCGLFIISIDPLIIDAALLSRHISFISVSYQFSFVFQPVALKLLQIIRFNHGRGIFPFKIDASPVSSENLFILIYHGRGLNSDLWFREMLCYQLSGQVYK